MYSRWFRRVGGHILLRLLRRLVDTQRAKLKACLESMASGLTLKRAELMEFIFTHAPGGVCWSIMTYL